MTYPLISEYVAAIQNAADNLDKLSGLKPVIDTHGEPVHSSGAFAVVFKMVDKNGKYFALKCFTEEQTGRDEAYRLIAEELDGVESKYLTSVRYYDKELFVDSNVSDETEFPVLLMDWIEGETMDVYIADNYQDNSAMEWLCYRFCKMASWLRSQPFAHGDIKPDNIIVNEDGELTLIDYDGMFVPAMKGWKSSTLGTKDFVHPNRKIEDFDETIDDFTLASIALSLKAISLDSSLYDKFGAPDRLLFSAEDYSDARKCEVLYHLPSLTSNIDLQRLIGLFYLALALGDLSTVSFRTLNIKRPSSIIVSFDENDIKSVKAAADSGNIEAQCILGNCYLFGRGVNKDESKAIELYNKSAGKGFARAQCNLGRCYEKGLGVGVDYAKAVEWYAKAVKQGYARAYYNLGNCYYKGKGVDIDYTKAVELYTKAAEQGYAKAQFNLGVCYKKGLGVDIDYTKAVELFTKAAEQGYARAQCNLGSCYRRGLGVDKDYTKVVEWYTKAAEQGDVIAQYHLGVLYEDGEGVIKDNGKAIEWYKKAAENGDAQAQCQVKALQSIS